MRIQTLVLLSAQLILPALAQVSINSSAIYQLSNDTEFAFTLEVVLSASNNRGAATGEVLRAASQIVPGDFESWYDEFLFLGNAIHAKAAGVNASRFPVSAREAYFRASTYYRNAPFYLHGNQSDPRINPVNVLAVEDFDEAAALLNPPAEKLNLSATSPNVKGNNFTVPIRFFKAQACNTTKLPTVIVGTGYDGAQEDLYHSNGVEILERGWNVVTYEGPGQPTVLREQGLGFIPDWWNVVTPVVDYLETREDVDTSKIALVGVSFGGQLAPLAASREPRLSAVLTIDSLYSIYDAFLAQFPSSLIKLYQSGNYSAFDKEILGAIASPESPTSLRWILAQSLFSFATTSPSDWWGRLPTFDVNASTVAAIAAPHVFLGDGENDSSAPGQAKQLQQWFGNRSTYNLFRTALGAGEHCQIGAEAQLGQVSLDWLADAWEGVSLPQNITGGVY